MAIALNVFQAGEKAIAQEVNDNFSMLQEEITTSIDGIKSDVQSSFTEAKEQILSDIEVVKNSKLDVDMSNFGFPYIKEFFQNESSWYILYSNDVLIQGGTSISEKKNPNANGNANITFLVKFADENYKINATCKAVSSDYLRMGVWNYVKKNVDSVVGNMRHVNEGGSASYPIDFDWIAYGKAAKEEQE